MNQKQRGKLYQYYQQNHELKSFREWWRIHTLLFRGAFNEIYQRRLLQLECFEGGFFLRVDTKKSKTLSRETQALIYETLETSVSGRQTIFVTAHAVGEGLKLFVPTVEQCEALEHTDPKFPICDYRQPFPTFSLEFPQNYSESRIARGWSHYHKEERDQLPLGVIIHHHAEQKALLMEVILSTGGLLTNTVDLRGDVTLHDRLLETRYVACDEPSKSANQDELSMLYRVCRLAINACSLLVHFGSVRIKGNTEENREKNRLQRAVQHARGDEIVVAETALRCHPVVYGFDQKIKLHEEERKETGEDSGEDEGEGGGESGWVMTPHWRMGSWVNQPCGVNWSERKRVFRRPVLVNAHLLRGPHSNTSVVVS